MTQIFCCDERRRLAVAAHGTLNGIDAGTSLLIVVGVALDTMAQVNQHLLLRKYDGFMKKGRVRFRGRSAGGSF